MAITHAIPELWSARILSEFTRVNVWSNLVSDASSEFAGGGDTLHLSSLTTTPTVKDYTRNQDIADPELMTDADLTLVIDQEKYFHIAVDDVDTVQMKPPLFSEFAQRAGQQVAKTVDEFLYTTWGASVPAAQKTSINPIPDNLNQTDAQLQTLVTSVNQIVKKLEDAGWPLESTYGVMNTKVAYALREYLTRKGSGNVGTGQLADRTFVSGSLTNLFGIRMLVDKNMSNAVTNGTPMINFGLTDAVYWARQVRKTVAYTPEKRFADAVKGLFVYGAKLVYPTHRHQLVTQT